MVEIKSGVLKDAKGQYKGMVIFQKGKKTFGRALPSYDGNAGSRPGLPKMPVWRQLSRFINR